MRFWAIALVLAACKYNSPQGQPPPDDGMPGGDGTDPDGNVDPGDGTVTFDAPTLPSAKCVGTFVTVCLPAPLTTGTLNITSLTIDTDKKADCDPVAIGTTIDACVRAAESITIDANLVATGSRPLILIATRVDGQIIINSQGVIDVASHRAGTTATRGAGSNPAICIANTPTGAGGGPGGAFGGNAGNGGNGAGGNGANGANATNATTLRGGCSGASGGNDGGERGNGGGAVDLIAPNILINGKINASGSSGFGGVGAVVTQQGGGGGGSGGLIVFDSTNITFNGGSVLMAEGAGGGQGSLAVTAGDPGSDPAFATIGTQANGGIGAGGGGTGGVGGSGGNAGNAGNSGAGGGGGGGGGTGRILNQSTTQQGTPTSSPAVVDL